MGSLGPYKQKHKVTVVGSGNWYVPAWRLACRISVWLLIAQKGHRYRQNRRREYCQQPCGL